MESQSKTDNRLWVLAVIFVAFTLLISAAGYVFYETQQRHIKRKSSEQLAAIADSKAHEITTWRNERMGDARTILAAGTFLANYLKLPNKDPSYDTSKREMLRWMAVMAQHHGYETVLLLGADGSILLSFPRENDVLCPDEQALAAKAVAGREIIFSDFYRQVSSEAIHLSLLVPIIPKGGVDQQPMGLMLLRIDPHQFLYPLIQAWPVPSRSGESLLVRREGDEVVFLNELRFRKGAALSLRIASNQPDIPAVRAALGEEGVVEGIDYRGVPVLAALRHISSSPWSIVAKVDQEEIYAPINTGGRYTLALVVLLVTGAGLGVGLLWREQQAQDKLRRNEELLRTVLELLPVGVRITDQAGRIVERNPASRRIFEAARDVRVDRDGNYEGWSVDSGKPIEPEEWAVARATKRAETSINEEVEIECVDGTRRIILSSTVPMRNVHGEITGTVSVNQDISERKRAERALMESEKQLKHLSSQLLTAHEQERKRVAQDIHDSLGSLLAAAKLRLERAIQQLSLEGIRGETDGLRSIVAMIQEAIQEVRRIQKTLRPSLLDDLGILPTITWFCREFQSVYADIRIEQHVTIREDDVPEPLKIVIFRIMQEALNNIAKHSGTEKVSLRLEKTPGTIDLIIEDNGRGFSLEEVAAMKGPERGLGLVSMRERAELSGGRCVIDSVEGRGTTVRATWPGVTTS